MARYHTNSGGKTHEVATKLPNAWGLYDMHGNVREWTADWWGAYSAESVTDPKGTSTGSKRVYRGGGWGSPGANLHVAIRGRETPSLRYFDLGFRLVQD